MKAKVKRIWVLILEELALFSSELMLVIILGLLSLWGFIYIAHLLITDKVQKFDNAALDWFSSIQSPGLTAFMKLITALGNPPTVVVPILLIFIYFLFIKPHRWFAIRIPVVALGSYLVNRILKYWFQRPRPAASERMVEVLYNLSFPSGHAMFSFAFYGLLTHILWKSIKNQALRIIVTAFMIILMILIGVSRVYLHVHYVTDVLAGFAAGFLWLLLCLFITRRIEKYIQKREKPVANS
jgi:membrane-associated phospholipid phosphatase